MLRIRYRLGLAFALLASMAAAEQRIGSGDRDYQIHLITWRPLGSVSAGVLVPVQINGGRMLRLVLDTGATGIVLSKRTARELMLQPVAPCTVAGFGKTGGQEGIASVAGFVRIGELRLEDVPVQQLPELHTREADGVIGMKVFEAFRIHLDARARELRLEAFTDKAQRGRQKDHLLFVRAKVNGSDEGTFLLDTGSAVTSLSDDMRWPAAPSGATVALNGVAGPVDARRLAPVSLEIAGTKITEREPVALNLDSLSRRNGVKVAGVLGYSVLSKAAVTINYRDGLVELGSGSFTQVH